MAADPHPTATLRSALDHGDIVEALSAASEIKVVPLSEALELRAPDGSAGPARFHGLAAVDGRYVGEHRVVDAVEAQAVLVLLTMLTGPSAKPAAQALAQLLTRAVRAGGGGAGRWAG